ncbi:uncharacterized protein I303_100964 [Kwoniella dejecticola CBS 10117]|uniref:BZIP domain-containing protein n=1 Tax=Kwoniella dejecticola CBS 10117 TaxID=1296121 RepID=A0A1A6AGG8_9TREE|nr:uncharacterized protein I303_00968 [Kwoniella dejecticola CBS 10117]OBR89146.1 hypothetical protein I303_00968 [Kwoniella dejecticola CBS 10117]
MAESSNQNQNQNQASVSTSSAPPSTGSNPPNSADGSNTPKDRHEPRGRKPNDKLPPSRAREVQRAFRLRRAEHLATLEERILHLEQENGSLRALLNLPIADKGRIGSGPTGRGKSLKEGGVPMSERVRARKEARARERTALGLPMVESSENETDDAMNSASGRDFRDSETLSPRASLPPPPIIPLSSNNSSSQLHQTQNQNNQNHNQNHNNAQNHNHNIQQPLFGNNANNNQNNNNGGNGGGVSPQPFNYQLPMPFTLPVSPDPQFPDFTSSLNASDLYKSTGSGSTPNFGGMFSMFDTPTDTDVSGTTGQTQSSSSTKNNLSPISPPSSYQHQQQHNQHQHNQHQQQQQQPVQLDLLTRLKSCCHVSDSHVVNDPGLLVFATRLCQQFGCSFNGTHTEMNPRSDNENLTLEDSWRSLKMTLDPGGDADGENRINTGKMAAELVIRAANSRSGNGNNTGWIMCRFREGLSVKKSMIQALVTGLGGVLE